MMNVYIYVILRSVNGIRFELCKFIALLFDSRPFANSSMLLVMIFDKDEGECIDDEINSCLLLMTSPLFFSVALL